MQARRRQAWLLVRNESVRGDRLRTSTCGAHTKELPACDHGRGKRGLQRERVRKGEASDQAGSFAWSGRARACALRGRRGFGFPEVWSTKKASTNQKKRRSAAAGWWGGGCLAFKGKESSYRGSEATLGGTIKSSPLHSATDRTQSEKNFQPLRVLHYNVNEEQETFKFDSI